MDILVISSVVYRLSQDFPNYSSGVYMTDQKKRLRFLSLNLVYLLKKNREVVKHEELQYGNAELGFAITMFRVDHKAYDYAAECFRLLGKEPSRECGVTMSVSFDAPEENNAFRNHFRG